MYNFYNSLSLFEHDEAFFLLLQCLFNFLSAWKFKILASFSFFLLLSLPYPIFHLIFVRIYWNCLLLIRSKAKKWDEAGAKRKSETASRSENWKAQKMAVKFFIYKNLMPNEFYLYFIFHKEEFKGWDEVEEIFTMKWYTYLLWWKGFIYRIKCDYDNVLKMLSIRWRAWILTFFHFYYLLDIFYSNKKYRFNL